jgi:hypothetical protein
MNVGQNLQIWLHDFTNWLNGPFATWLAGPVSNFLATGWGMVAVITGFLLIIGLPLWVSWIRHLSWQARLVIWVATIVGGVTGIGWLVALVVALKAPNMQKLSREEQRDRERAAMHDNVVRYKTFESDYRNN